MASTIDQFPTRKRGRPPIYDWDSLFDGQIHVYFQGQDFQVDPKSFRALVHRTASARLGGPWKAETHLDLKGGSVSFRFYRPE